MSVVLLTSLGIIHWSIVLFMCFYVFVRKTKQYDWIYLLIVGVIITQWFIVGECCISYFEKKIMDPSYTLNDKPAFNPSLNLYIENIIIKNIILIAQLVLFLYNIIYLAIDYKIPAWVIITFVGLLTGWLFYYRCVDYINNITDNHINNDDIPLYIKESPYLMSIYNKKTNKKIGHIDVLNFLSCFLFSKCSQQKITWDLFDEHVNILRSNITEPYGYIVGIASGGAFVAKKLDNAALFIKISKYDESSLNGETLKVTTSSDLSKLRGATVLVVDDQCSTGDTLRRAKQYLLETCGARSVKTGVLYSRKELDIIDYYGMPFTVALSPWGYAA
jgi:hypoxanthine phosphoribosyltransferase